MKRVPPAQIPRPVPSVLHGTDYFVVSLGLFPIELLPPADVSILLLCHAFAGSTSPGKSDMRTPQITGTTVPTEEAAWSRRRYGAAESP